MNNLARRKPTNVLRMLDSIGKGEDLFSTIADDFFHFHGFSPFKGLSNPDFSPALDFIDKEKEYLIKLEIPGIEKNEVEVEIDDNILIIKGEKKTESKEENDEMYVCERTYGAFRRELQLPTNCNKEKIEANYKDGILSLSLPKTEIKEKEKKKICIK